ncbi:MAG TPA: NADH-quinone oxidoreductase subunit A [Candidatus Tectomicrobia bacterium]|jgi:NADH-quinone oxidoreductase subunit A
MSLLPVFLTFLLGALVCILLLSLSRFVGPRRPNPVKAMAFECGMEQITKPRMQFSVKFSVIAMLFILFDIEVAFLYPWAVLFRQLGVLGLVEVLFFLLVLTVGLLYAWKRGALEWD